MINGSSHNTYRDHERFCMSLFKIEIRSCNLMKNNQLFFCHKKGISVVSSKTIGWWRSFISAKFWRRATSYGVKLQNDLIEKE